MTTYTRPVLPVGLERSLRELGCRTGTDPAEVVDLARAAGMFLAATAVSEPDERDTFAFMLAKERIITIVELACACSVEVRPTTEYDACLCWAGTVKRRMDRFLNTVERSRLRNNAVE